MADKIPLYILQNLFYCFVHGDETKYWRECVPVSSHAGMVGGGYIVAEADGTFYHTYHHPDNIYKDNIYNMKTNILPWMGGS